MRRIKRKKKKASLCNEMHFRALAPKPHTRVHRKHPRHPSKTECSLVLGKKTIEKKERKKKIYIYRMTTSSDNKSTCQSAHMRHPRAGPWVDCRLVCRTTDDHLPPSQPTHRGKSKKKRTNHWQTQVNKGRAGASDAPLQHPK